MFFAVHPVQVNPIKVMMMSVAYRSVNFMERMSFVDGL
jgi:hypothetical protein